MKVIVRILLVSLTASLAFGQLFINEIDYDQVGTDSQEYVEIAGPAGTYTNVRVEHINGNGDVLVLAVDISSLTLSNESDGYGFYVIGASTVENVDNTPADWPAENILQNGPDAVVLKLDNVIIDAVSYEGEMTDADGNVMENAGGDIAYDDASYALSRVGLDGSSWELVYSTPGTVNPNQSFIPCPQYGELTLTPTTPTEEDAVSVCIVITDPDGTVGSVVMTYFVNGDAGTDVTLTSSYCGDNTWGGEIPAQAANSIVEFFITAIDNDANEAVSPTYDYMVISSAGVTIYDIQFNDSDVGADCYDSPLLGQTLTFSGIVTASGSGSYFIQDGTGAWNGVFVYDSGNSAVIGDDVTLVAKVSEYYGMTEITDVSSYTVNSSGNSLPEPTFVSTGDLAGSCSPTGEAYEGVLVQLTNVQVTAGADDFDQWWVDDGTGACEVEDKYFPYTPAIGDVFETIIGVVEYGYDEYAVCPRDADDLIISSSAPAFTNEVFNKTFYTQSNEIEFTIDIIPPEETLSVTSAKIWYGTDGNFLNSTDIYNLGGNTWMGIIPAQAGNSLLEFKVVATQSDGWDYESEVFDVLIASSTPTPIADIQADPVEGEIVTVEGILTIGSGVIQTGMTKAYIQDNSGRGINLFNYDEVSMNRGDEVTAVGIIDVYYSTVEVSDFDFQIVSTGNDLPAAANITVGEANSSDWEGTFIEFEGEIIAIDDLTDGTKFTLEESGDTTFVMIWNSTNISTTSLTKGSSWSFTGVGSQYYDDYQLLVGYQEDIQPATGIDDMDLRPYVFSLAPAYPNPFNPSTTLRWTLSESTAFALKIFDLQGREIAILAEGNSPAGQYLVEWNASGLSSGLYIVQLQAGDYRAMQKVLLVK